MTDFDKLFQGVDKMFDSINRRMDEVSKGVDAHMAQLDISITNSVLKNSKLTSKKVQEHAAALQSIRDSLIGKEGMMVEFTIWNPTFWQGVGEFLGLWKRKRIGMIVVAPAKVTFECVVEEPDKTRHNVHVLHLTTINPLDALARGV